MNSEKVDEGRIGTAAILESLNLDSETITGVLNNSGPLVEEAAKLALVSAKGKSDREAENIRNVFFAMASDIRVILIRLAASLQALRTIDSLPEENQKVLAQECLDIYAPLAGRLGISWIKTELEDLAFKQLNRDVYSQIKEIVALKRGEREEFLESIKSTIEKEVEGTGINIKLESRAKHFYSIYLKMRRRNKAPGSLYDLFGLRILCPGAENCYTLLGLLHRLWKPVDGRFKDYIAAPKPNGYQSLHTTVLAGGSQLEIQIRTFEMHETAEYGVAGHWFYKNQGAAGNAAGDKDLIRRLRGWNEAGGKDFLDEIRKDLLKNRIYVFTPQGKVIDLPKGATPLDFAYAVHSAIGDSCMAAKADGAIIPLAAELKSAQTVEIITASNAHPNRNWLNEVKTARARNKIRAWFSRQEEAEFRPKAAGKKKEAAAPPTQTETGSNAPPAVERHFPGTEPGAGPVFKVRVGDEKNMMIRFARCCSPTFGDHITGYVSRGRGIIIHRADCHNLSGIPDFNDRRIEVRWEDTELPVKRFKKTRGAPAVNNVQNLE